MTRRNIKAVQDAYAWLKKDLLISQVRYDLFGQDSFGDKHMTHIEHKKYLELLHLVSDLGDLARSHTKREGRKNDQQVFDDRRKEA